MKYKIYKEIIPEYNAVQQILHNRGIEEEDMYHYLNTTDDDINKPELLGKNKMAAAAQKVLDAIDNNKKAFICVDSDCDRFHEFRTFY